jgi:hypothetical protein
VASPARAVTNCARRSLAAGVLPPSWQAHIFSLAFDPGNSNPPGAAPGLCLPGSYAACFPPCQSTITPALLRHPLPRFADRGGGMKKHAIRPVLACLYWVGWSAPVLKALRRRVLRKRQRRCHPPARRQLRRRLRPFPAHRRPPSSAWCQLSPAPQPKLESPRRPEPASRQSRPLCLT